MNSPRYARWAAGILARLPVSGSAPRDGERAAAITRIEDALRQKGRRRKRQRWVALGAGFSAAAAGALFAFSTRSHGALHDIEYVSAVVTPVGSGARLVSAAGSEPLRNGGTLALGERLVANAEGGATLHLSTGTELSIEHDASLALSEAGPTEHFELSRGSMQAHVAKLRAGQRFIVSTPDADVEVHGTVFRVTVLEPAAACADGQRTQVSVSEGVVEVRAGSQRSYVHPGERWPGQCQNVQPAPRGSEATVESTRPSESLWPRAAAITGSPGLRPPAKTAARPAVTIAAAAEKARQSLAKDQNDLFSQAVAARHRGDVSGALTKFQALLSQYPGSPLAEGASAERMRLLAAAGNVATAQRAAREYLARYPQGFAHGDANAILNGR